MRLFAVRFFGNKEAVGFFFAEEDEDLLSMVDAVCDPAECEYQEIDEPAAVTWEGAAPTLGCDVPDGSIDQHYQQLRDGASFQFAFDELSTGKSKEPWLRLLDSDDPAGASVYFIRAGSFIKIGFTAGSPNKRMASLATATAETLELLMSLPGTMADEKQLHEQFAALRERGEWFRAEAPLLDFIASRKAGAR